MVASAAALAFEEKLLEGWSWFTLAASVWREFKAVVHIYDLGHSEVVYCRANVEANEWKSCMLDCGCVR